MKPSPATSHEDTSPLERAKLMLDAKAVIEHYDRIIGTIDEHRLVLDQREADFVMTVEDYQVLRDFASRDDAPTQAINLEGVTGDEMDKSADRAALLTRLMAAGTTRSEMRQKEMCKAGEFGCGCGRPDTEPCPLPHPRSTPSAIEPKFVEIGVLNRPRSGEVHFIQEAFSIPLPIHGTLKVYIKEGE